MRGLAFRRHTESVKKLWAKRALSSRWSTSVTPAAVGIYAHSPARCSCFMCGNPRKYYGNGHAQKISEIRQLPAEDYVD